MKKLAAASGGSGVACQTWHITDGPLPDSPGPCTTCFSSWLNMSRSPFEKFFSVFETPAYRIRSACAR